MASRRLCKSRVTADAAAEMLNNWDSSSSEQSDSDLDSDFDVGKWDCSSSSSSSSSGSGSGSSSSSRSSCSDCESTITSTRGVVATTSAAIGRSVGTTAGGSTSRITTSPKRSAGDGS